MTRYVLLAVTCPDDQLPADGGDLFDVVGRGAGVVVEAVAAGTPAEVLVAAAGRCSAGELYQLRLHKLPRAHRAVGDREWREHFAAEAAGRN